MAALSARPDCPHSVALPEHPPDKAAFKGSCPVSFKKPLSSDPLNWFRLYGEVIDDDKLRLLAFEDRWHFIALLCCKSKGILDTAGELLARRVALRLGLSVLELEIVAKRLADVGLIDATTYQPLAWEKRQRRSDSDHTNRDRQKRFRDKEKAANALRNGAVTRTEKRREEEEVEKRPKTLPSQEEDIWGVVGVHGGDVKKIFGEKIDLKTGEVM